MKSSIHSPTVTAVRSDHRSRGGLLRGFRVWFPLDNNLPSVRRIRLECSRFLVHPLSKNSCLELSMISDGDRSCRCPSDTTSCTRWTQTDNEPAGFCEPPPDKPSAQECKRGKLVGFLMSLISKIMEQQQRKRHMSSRRNNYF